MYVFSSIAWQNWVPVSKVAMIAAVASVCAGVATELHRLAIGSVPNNAWSLAVRLIVKLRNELSNVSRFAIYSQSPQHSHID